MSIGLKVVMYIILLPLWVTGLEMLSGNKWSRRQWFGFILFSFSNIGFTWLVIS